MGGGVELPARKEPVKAVVPKESKLVAWWKKLIYEEYHLTIWFVEGKTVDGNGNATYKRIPKKYKAVKVNKISPKLIKFVDMEKHPVEIRSEEPMNWDLIKVY
tara:strand:+ start:187 stop:495 length:309 start_codon:yes stop_codon:yes gene_type:complete